MQNARYCVMHQRTYLFEDGCPQCSNAATAKRLADAIEDGRNPPLETFADSLTDPEDL